MSPEAQRIAIAEACGWSDVKFSEANNAIVGVAPLDWQKRNPISKLSSKFRIANYLNDLNAMHQAEEVLNDDPSEVDGEWNRYRRHLVDICHRDETDIIHAHPHQRAEAFLRAIRKWVES